MIEPVVTVEADDVAIRLEGVEKRFGPKTVLAGVDLAIRRGESVVLIGGSGTGKSVLLKHMIALIRPDAGRVLVDGVDVSTLSTRELTTFRRRFGMAFQEGALFDSMSVWDNVAFPLRRARWSKADVDRRVAECLELVRLDGAGAKATDELSGGMRRRVGFARAIALEPEILLLDEPTTGLDPVTSAVVEEIIVHLNDTLHATAVTITHDMESAFRIADRIGMLHAGRVIAMAEPERFRELEDPRVRQFLERRPDGPLTDDETENA